MKKWYYDINGRQSKPLTKEEIILEIETGNVKRETLVWNGVGKWQSAKDALKEYFNNVPPKLELKHTWMWLLLISPSIFSFFSIENLTISTMVSYLLIYILLKLDQSELRKKGYESPSEILGIAVPYLYVLKRKEITKDESSYSKWFNIIFWLGMIFYLIGIVLIFNSGDVLGTSLMDDLVSTALVLLVLIVGDKHESKRIGAKSPSLISGLLFPPYYLWKKGKYSEGSLVFTIMTLSTYITLIPIIMMFI